jgi:hypothetical protein
MRQAVWLILAVAINATLAAVSQAQTNSCISSVDGFWDESRLWSLNKPPSIKQSAILITNVASETVTIDSTTATHFKNTLIISNLVIAPPSGSTDALYLNNTGTIALHILKGLSVGSATGGAELIGSNSTLIVDGLLGGQLQDAGRMVITCGSMITTNCSLLVSAASDSAEGLLILSNVVLQARDVAIGESANGTVEVIGGTVTLSSSLNVDGVQQSQGSLLVADRGLVIVTNGSTNIGGEIDSGATLAVSNASFRAADVFISGFAEVTINVGTVTLNGQLAIGLGDQAAGFVSLNGGVLAVTNGSTYVGFENFGEFNVSDGLFLARDVNMSALRERQACGSINGGTSVISSNLQLGSSDGLYGANVSIIGWPTVRHQRSDRLVTDEDNLAQIEISGGHLAAKAIELGRLGRDFVFFSGTLAVNGGSVTTSTGITLGDCASNTFGYVTVDGGHLIVTNAAHTGFIDIQNGQLDLSSGVLRVDKLVMTNTCSSFVHTGGTLIVGSVVLDPNAFQITSVAREGNNLRITWLMAPGQTNALQVSSGGPHGAYTTNIFTDLFTVTNNTTAGSLTNYLDIGAATNKPSRYYRARLSP